MSALAKPEYTEVILAGELGKKFGRVWNLVVKTPVHAIKLIGLNCPAFKAHIIDSAKKNHYYHIIVDKRARSEAELQLPAGKRLIIAPAVVGAGGKVLGIIEVVAAFVLAVVATFVPGLQGFAPGLYATAFGLAVGGITQLLTSIPKVGTGQASSSLQSFYFNGASNTQQQGGPVTVVYGQMLVGSQVVSASLQAVDASQAGDISGLITQ